MLHNYKSVRHLCDNCNYCVYIHTEITQHKFTLLKCNIFIRYCITQHLGKRWFCSSWNHSYAITMGTVTEAMSIRSRKRHKCGLLWFERTTMVKQTLLMDWEPKKWKIIYFSKIEFCEWLTSGLNEGWFVFQVWAGKWKTQRKWWGKDKGHWREEGGKLDDGWRMQT